MLKILLHGVLSLMFLGQMSLSQAHAPRALTPEQQQQFDTVRLYSSFFHRVQAVEVLAQHSEAAGTDPKHLTRKLMLQNDAQLTDQEYEAVRTITIDHNAKRDAAIAQLNNAADSFKQANGSTANLFSDPGVRKQVSDTNKQVFQNTLDHMNQLKVALGDARFQQLDQWVRTQMRSRHSTKASPAPGPS